MVVTRRDLEGLLAQLTQRVVDPREGLFGPRSISWRVNREAVLFAGGGRAALLQLAHPYVSHAIEQHSPTKSDPQGRFVRTFTHVFTMLFGDLASTVDAARRVHKRHAGIRGRVTEASPHYDVGHSYAANNEEALLWVFATLVDTTIKTYSLLVRPLSQSERGQYYDEAKLFGQLFGIPETRLPQDWDAFQRYVDGVIESNLLHVTGFAREMAGFLLNSPAPMYKPLMAGYRVFTAGMLPHSLRAPYGLPVSPAAQAAFWLEVRTLRTGIAGLPARLRYFPAYVDAQRRVAGKGPDLLGRWLEKVAIRNLPQAAR